jgi:bis(5'-nucleosyl)-tetraphosphatase (symmetrical)
MAHYVVGDLQGCYSALQQLLEKIQFDPANDVLWSVGDVVNRGSESLACLRFIKSLGDSAVMVLGNHDLHLLAVGFSPLSQIKPKDTFEDILNAPDRDELLHWLRHRPLLHHDAELDFTLLHAGLPPQWNLEIAKQRAIEVETWLRGDEYVTYLNHLYGCPDQAWQDSMTGWDRLRFIVSCFSRLRYCSAAGRLRLDFNLGLDAVAGEKDIYPWFRCPERASKQTRIVFGHWSTLGYVDEHNVYGLDTGCLWGGALTALRLQDQQVFQVPCQAAQNPADFL